ncbi:MAG: hypothetical protein NZL83_04485 [Candidatus Absconditabacterales bacterium]|nr:hypothetical protein [Candidatus Absconditabacterales bacterium]
MYIQFLIQAGIVYLLPFCGNISDTMRKSKKYILASPHIISLFADTIGCMRESFFVSSLKSILTPIPHMNLFHQSHTDFVFEYKGQTYFFEIGGKEKKRTTTAPNLFVIKDDIMIGQGNEISLRFVWIAVDGVVCAKSLCLSIFLVIMKQFFLPCFWQYVCVLNRGGGFCVTYFPRNSSWGFGDSIMSVVYQLLAGSYYLLVGGGVVRLVCGAKHYVRDFLWFIMLGSILLWLGI